MDQLDQKTVKRILDSANALSKAQIFQGTTQKPFQIQAITLALDTAQLSTNPMKINFPFKSVYVQAATDSSTTVNIRPTSQDSFQSAVPVKLNDVLTSESMISNAYLDWTAQAGKSITLIFFTDARFVSGSLLTTTAGGVSITDGSGFSMSVVTLAAITAGQLCSQDTTRKVAVIQNLTGASIWLGNSGVTDSSVTLTQGFELTAGATLRWQNSQALYGYSVAGGNVHVTLEN